MTVNIEKMRFDIAETQRQAEVRRREWEQNQRWELLKLLVSAIVAAAALLGAGAAIGNYLARHFEPPAIQQPMFPPGTVITIPAAPVVVQPAPVQPK
jgi:flagellar biosynthesis/type III secretory pathway M-ring protein FliF/YscJ